MMSFKLKHGVKVLGLALTAGLLWGNFGQRNTMTIVATIKARVPQASSVLAFTGSGFSAGKGRSFVANGASDSKANPAQVLHVTAPARANGSFDIRDGRGVSHATLRLPGAARQEAHLEEGALVYPNAYPGVDVVLARDPARLEVSYVAQSTSVPPLHIDLGSDDDGALSLEKTSGAAVMRGADGRPKLRVERPVAFDAEGRRREGAYAIADAHTLRVDMNLQGLTPPIVIDPALFIPFWTMDDDVRGPGNIAYDVNRQSREAQIVVNGLNGKPWLIRPARSLQPQYYDEPLGADRPEEWYSAVSATPRTPGQNGPPPNPLVDKDFRRTINDESETYEWDTDGWRLLPHTNLPGFIDPTFAFDAKRGRLIAIGGRLQGTSEETASLFASAVFENDGTGWTGVGVPGAPTPRIRAASVGFGSNIVVFGGRSLAPPADLLNDTWVYDGRTWRKVPVSNPPPACEGSQLVHDTRRDRVVLIGGNCSFDRTAFNPSDVDGFRLWEFDGSDWTRRFDSDDAALPKSFRPRRAVAAAWNPVRRTTMLFGGFVDVTEICALSTADVAAKRYQANLDIYFNNDFTLKTQLEQQGCWGGYVHDTWEWDGATLRALTSVAYGASSINRQSHQVPIFQQVSSQIPPPTAAIDNLAPATTTKLWPWRYDARSDHFAQRSALERSSAQAGVPNAAPGSLAAQSVTASGGSSSIVSPMFAPAARPQLVVKPDGKLMVFSSDDGQVFETDLATWTNRTPAKTPFAQGQNDFFAAAFDTGRKKTVLFDPTTGVTWEHDNAAGWQRLSTDTSPGVWSEPAWFRLMRDPNVGGYGTTFLVRLPRMTYDRARGRTIMLYREALWELNGTTWSQYAVPAALKGCSTATVMTYDGTRNRTVVVGCQVPAQTWEWDGAAWLGPFASPFKDLVMRPVAQPFAGLSYMASLQLEFMHPNALFESPTLGGVGIIDGGGTMRVWQGTEWQEKGGWFGDPVETDAWNNYNTNASQLSNSTPTGFYPPVVEDFSAGRLLGFRDGIRATRELRLLPQVAITWEDTFVGNAFSTGVGLNNAAVVYPFPAELLPSEYIRSQAFHDPATVVDLSGQLVVKTFDLVYGNLSWPFRLLSDPVAHRVRVLTHRGVFWELGSERISERGEGCSTSNDCAAGEVCSQGVCCEHACDGKCLTCNGAHPGTCEAIPAGQPDPKGLCGTGDCAGVCSGVLQSSSGFSSSSCLFAAGRPCGTGLSCNNGQLTGGGSCAPTGPVCVAGTSQTTLCAGGLGCADATSCKTGCASPSDCTAPNQACSADGKACVGDGKVCHNNGECPRFNTCAGDGTRCQPDAVLQAAAEHGVQPSEWQPSIARTPAQVAHALKQQGYEEDSDGRILLTLESPSGLDLRFDPNQNTPQTGFLACIHRIERCRFETRALDQCIAAAPRCESATPWANDPGGFDCCPAGCLSAYFSSRSSMDPDEAMGELIKGQCYPEYVSYMEGQP